MSLLVGKKVLFLGQNQQFTPIEALLIQHGVHVSHITCEVADLPTIQAALPDIIVIDYEVPETACTGVLDVMQDSEYTKQVPVIASIPNSPSDIERALLSGAADYVTATDSTDVIIQKIKSALGIPDNFSGSSDIDISSSEVTSSGGPIKVFVVEDDPLLRNLLSIRLAKAKLPFEFSSDGTRALPAMHQFRPDIIILDLMLPGKSGFEIMAELQSDTLLQHIPIVVFSNRDSKEDKQKAEQYGAKKFYVKAMTDLTELIETITKLVPR